MKPKLSAPDRKLAFRMKCSVWCAASQIMMFVWSPKTTGLPGGPTPEQDHAEAVVTTAKRAAAQLLFRVVVNDEKELWSFGRSMTPLTRGGSERVGSSRAAASNANPGLLSFGLIRSSYCNE